MSQFQPSYQPPYKKPARPPGATGCTKVAIAAVVLLTLGFSVCCVGGAIFVRQSFTSSPPRVVEIGNRILVWDAYSRLPPVGGLDVGLARFATFGDPDVGFILVADSRLGNSELTGRQFDGQIKAQLSTEFEKTELIERGNREIKVRGEVLNFQFNETRGEKTGQRYWELAGVVQGAQFPTFIFIQLRQSRFSEIDVLALVESIR